MQVIVFTFLQFLKVSLGGAGVKKIIKLLKFSLDGVKLNLIEKLIKQVVFSL